MYIRTFMALFTWQVHKQCVVPYNNRTAPQACLHDIGTTFTPVPCHSSVFAYMIPPENVILEQTTPAWVHPGRYCTRTRTYRIYSNKRHIWVKKVNKRRPRISAKVPMWRLLEDLHRTTKRLQSNSKTAQKRKVRLKVSENTTGRAIKKCQRRRTGTIKRHFQ